MIAQWSQPAPESRVWLMYSASYLLRTGDVRWAIDPVRLQHRLPAVPEVGRAHDLSPLSFVLLTHWHGDHLDLPLIHSLRDLPITWIVPRALLATVTEVASIPGRRIIVAAGLEPIELGGIQITPFDGMHRECLSEGGAERKPGVPALGYLVESGSKRWLFAGDTRAYAAGGLPPFGSVDALFAHVWLGRSAALQHSPPLLDQFCRWCLDLCPARILLTHLEEFGRTLEDYWDALHAARITARLKQLSPATAVRSLLLGESAAL